MSARELLDLLAQRHTQDKAVFVGECAMGPQGSRRLDAWALLKTWAPWTAIGYEIKVSRSDFLGDRKWSEYLGVCHELYFVAPPKLIDPAELPEAVGLLVAHGSRLVTKRKAVRREPDPARLARLMSYVLMSRSRVVANMWEANGQRGESGEDFWRRWLDDKRERRNLGAAVGKRLRAEFEAERSARLAAEREHDRLDGVRRALDEMGFGEDASAWAIKAKLQRAGDGLDVPELRATLQRALALVPRG